MKAWLLIEYYERLENIPIVNKEAGKIRNVKQAVRAKMIDFIIADAVKRFGLKFTNVKIIYYGKTKL